MFATSSRLFNGHNKYNMSYSLPSMKELDPSRGQVECVVCWYSRWRGTLLFSLFSSLLSPAPPVPSSLLPPPSYHGSFTPVCCLLYFVVEVALAVLVTMLVHIFCGQPITRLAAAVAQEVGPLQAGRHQRRQAIARPAHDDIVLVFFHRSY